LTKNLDFWILIPVSATKPASLPKPAKDWVSKSIDTDPGTYARFAAMAKLRNVEIRELVREAMIDSLAKHGFRATN